MKQDDSIVGLTAEDRQWLIAVLLGAKDTNFLYSPQGKAKADEMIARLRR